MTGFTFGVDAVYAAQRYSRELVESVWSVRFYEYLIDVLTNGTWKEYSTKAYGRPCRFSDVREFITHEDGLAWPAVEETLCMINVVSNCTAPLPPEKNASSDKPLQRWASEALAALKAVGVTREFAAGDRAQAQPLAEHGTNQHREPQGDAGVADSHSTPANRLSSDSQERILRRLGRDAPEVLERFKAGEFTSARAAAIEAGIIRPVPSVRLSDPEKVAAKIRQHWTPEQITALLRLLHPA